MTIPSTGKIDLNGDIAKTFGGIKPDGLGEYYKNGGIVDTNNPAPIPRSGEIKFSDFRGANKYVPPVTPPPDFTNLYQFKGCGFEPGPGNTLTAGVSANWYLTASISYIDAVYNFPAGTWSVRLEPFDGSSAAVTRTWSIGGAVPGNQAAPVVSFTPPAAWKGKAVIYAVSYSFTFSSTGRVMSGSSDFRSYHFK